MLGLVAPLEFALAQHFVDWRITQGPDVRALLGVKPDTPRLSRAETPQARRKSMRRYRL